MTVNGNKHTITETMDTLGRSTGYVLDKNATPLDTVAYAYSEQGRLAKASFQHGGEEKIFAYSYLPGTNLLHAIAHPNGITVTRTYEERRELATSINATRGDTNVVLLGYTYDQLGRPVTRKRSRQAVTRSDNFAYNDRSELTNARLGTTPYTYEYDNIGNRETAQEAAQALTTYATNPLNQYSGITQGAETPFTPEYDVAGNQTKVKTSTGIWMVAYDANNRPVSFTSQDGQTVIACGYDYMGRRFMKKVSVGATVKLHQFYLYRGYLQIAALDMTRNNLPALWFTQWDPTQPVATRPLSIRKNGTWYTYGHDLTKNVTELYQTNGTIAAAYDYTPYGAVTATGIDQPFQWSCEVYDAELGMVYYNYRHYNPIDGRWIGRDLIAEKGGYNLYGFTKNNGITRWDVYGLKPSFVPIPHPEFPTPTFNGGNIWPDGSYTPSGTPPHIPLTPDNMASQFCRYSIPAPKCKCEDGSEVSDSYPSKAEAICIDFLKRYRFSIAVISTAICLAKSEDECQKIQCCSKRNNCRLKAHSSCYSSRGFVPIFGLPDGGAEVGWDMLLNDSQCK